MRQKGKAPTRGYLKLFLAILLWFPAHSSTKRRHRQCQLCKCYCYCIQIRYQWTKTSQIRSEKGFKVLVSRYPRIARPKRHKWGFQCRKMWGSSSANVAIARLKPPKYPFTNSSAPRTTQRISCGSHEPHRKVKKRRITWFTMAVVGVKWYMAQHSDRSYECLVLRCFKEYSVTLGNILLQNCNMQECDS